jgi:hypothetical protein
LRIEKCLFKSKIGSLAVSPDGPGTEVVESVLDFEDYKSRHLLSLKSGIWSKQSRGSDQLDIDALSFRCPATQRVIASGIEMDRRTSCRSDDSAHACAVGLAGGCHEFIVARGNLAPFTRFQPAGASNSGPLSPTDHLVR